jgi:hypothetical protein
MGKFNFKLMEAGNKVVTRDGVDATFIKYDYRDPTYPLCIYIEGEMMYLWHSIDGVSANHPKFDLFMK